MQYLKDHDITGGICIARRLIDHEAKNWKKYNDVGTDNVLNCYMDIFAVHEITTVQFCSQNSSLWIDVERNARKVKLNQPISVVALTPCRAMP